jgi:hypothetical protein
MQALVEVQVGKVSLRRFSTDVVRDLITLIFPYLPSKGRKSNAAAQLIILKKQERTAIPSKASIKVLVILQGTFVKDSKNEATRRHQRNPNI